MLKISDKFQTAVQAIAQQLIQPNLEALEKLSHDLKLSFQQIKQSAEIALAWQDWKQESFAAWLKNKSFEKRDFFWKELQTKHSDLLQQKAEYSNSNNKIIKKEKYEIQSVKIKSPVFKTCPAASSDWLCCGLKTIDLVENCNLGCSYCVLQDFYPESVIKIASNIEERLAQIKLSPERKYRVTTGEYSDSLLWGNQNGLLDRLLDFALKNTNALIELKTKSVNIDWLVINHLKIPENFITTWSLNPEIIIQNEEAATPSLKQRLAAAKKLADLGLGIGFHFHPLIQFQNCFEEYEKLGNLIAETFDPKTIKVISFGCLAFSKSSLKAYRKRVRSSKLLQSEFELSGDNKYSYPSKVKIQLYQAILKGLKQATNEHGSFLENIPHYLCMEPAKVWKEVLPEYAHLSTAEFSQQFIEKLFKQLNPA